MPPFQTNPGAVIAGQLAITTTGLATQFPENQLQNGVSVKADAANSPNGCFIGAAGVNNTGAGNGNGYKLLPGESVPVFCNDTNQIYAAGVIGDALYFMGN